MRSHARGRGSAALTHRWASACALALVSTGYVSTSIASASAVKGRADVLDPLDYRGLAYGPEELPLARGACAPEEKAQPISLQQTPSQNIEAKVQLLASRNALPVMYAADNPDIEPGGLSTNGATS